MWDEISCGEYILCSPPIPSDRSAFLNGHVTKKKDQKFEHTDLPTRKEYEAWPKHKQKELEDREWERREKGVWFYNCGVPTYITGKNYFYLNYHRYGRSKPDYREAHRRFFWVWENVQNALNSLGLYAQTRRRWGKTSIAASIALESATRIPDFRVGIQSKTEPDAQVLFNDHILKPFEALKECPWFMPQVSSAPRQQKVLEFDTPVTRTKGAANMPDRIKGLKSSIDHREPVETAYDSQGIGLFLNDEVGKKQRYDPFNRHSVVSKQFDPDGEIIGKELATTTSDEKDDASVEKCAEFWNNSNHTLLVDENGQLVEDRRTESGLWRVFFPDYEGFMCDEYGRDTEAGRKFMDQRRAEVMKDPVKYLRRRRAYPRTPEEALLPSVKTDCIVNAEHVGDVMSRVAVLDTSPTFRCRLEWVDETETQVRIVRDKDAGRFLFSWIPPAELLNRMEVIDTITTKRGTVRQWKPQQAHRFGSGADPIDMKKPEGRGSRAAGHGFFKFDPDMEARRGTPEYWPSHSFICEYMERPKDPDVYYEDMLMLVHVLGCQCFPETQKVKLMDYFEARGYGLCIAKRPASTQSQYTQNQKKAGAASSSLMINAYSHELVSYVENFIGTEETKSASGKVGVNDEGIPYDWRRMPFPRTLQQWLDFDPDNTKIYDLAVSSGFTLCDATRFVPKPPPVDPEGGLSAQGIRLRNLYR